MIAGKLDQLQLTDVTGITRSDSLIAVGLGEIRVSRDPAAVLVSFGLGSCVAVCAYDLTARVGGMMHVVLPYCSNKDSARRFPGKYADIGMPMLIRELENHGAIRTRIQVKIAGGASVIHAATFDGLLDMGQKNVVAVRAALEREGLPIVSFDTGGNRGRSVWLLVGTGAMTVRTASGATVYP
jgi:chemotaxis protein CheD